MTEFLIEIGHNLALLLSMALFFLLLRQVLPEARRVGYMLRGVMFGVTAICSMLTSFNYQAGLIFDSRSIILSLAGLFSGSWGGVIAMAIAGTYRAWLGGPGALAGLAVIVVASTGGIAARQIIRRRSWPPTALQLWLVGLSVHLLTMACMLLLPLEIFKEIFTKLAIPFLGIFPLGTVVLGIIMASGERLSTNLDRLQHAEWLFSQAQQVTRFGSWEYHLPTDRLTATPNFHALLGIAGQTQKLSLQDLFGRLHKEDWESFLRAFDTAIAAREDLDIQGRLVREDGEMIWVRLVGKPLQSKGTVTHIVGNLIDISRRKIIELELRSSEERLQAILDYAPALICICNLEGTVILHNRHFKVFGERATGVGKPLYELLPRGGALEQWVDDLMALQAGQYVEFEEVLRHADGTVHTYLTSKFLLAASPHHAASICYIATDITELRRTIAERQQLTEELTAKNEELEHFTYTVSHDLKAPLLTIGSYSGLLREDVAAGRDDRIDEDLEFIGAAVVKMRQMIDALLELSRIGRTAGELSAVELSPVVNEILLMVAGEVQESGASIVTAPDLPTVCGNPLRLQQVMQNLVQNALKFRDPDRPLRVEIDGRSNPDGSVVVTVSDNGIGLPVHRLESVFEMFVHGQGAGAGTGIGLAMVRRIMKAFGGSVWAESAGEGAGSTFFLRFPAPPAGDVPCPGGEPAGTVDGQPDRAVTVMEMESNCQRKNA